MSLRKIIAITALIVLSSQIAWANYAFYRQIVNTFKLYRMPVDEKKMVLTKNDDGSYHFSIEMKAKLRNDFETPMLVAFISVGQAISHQESFAKKKQNFKPVIPRNTEVTVITSISREGLVISAKASPDQIKKLSQGQLDPASFMRLIKDSIQTL